jgi:beta-glucosidase
VDAPPGAPIRALKAFRRVTLAPGETRRVTFTLGDADIAEIDANGKAVVVPGLYDIAVGGRQPGPAGRTGASTTGVVTGRVEVR